MAKHDEQNAAILDQFGKQAEEYAKLMAATSGDVTLGPLLKATRIGPQDQVLDVGCGTGRLTLALAKIAGHVTGVDLTPAMLAEAKALQAQEGIKNVTWRQGDMLPLADEDGRYSAVVTRATFHHLADPLAVLKEMVRVCKPGGRVAVIDLTPSPAKADAFNRAERLRDPSHMRAMTSAELRNLGRSAGLAERAFESFASSLPLDAVLKTSFPAPGNMERVRALYRQDADSGADMLGFRARWEEGKIIVSYPTTLAAWETPAARP